MIALAALEVVALHTEAVGRGDRCIGEMVADTATPAGLAGGEVDGAEVMAPFEGVEQRGRAVRRDGEVAQPRAEKRVDGPGLGILRWRPGPLPADEFGGGNTDGHGGIDRHGERAAAGRGRAFFDQPARAISQHDPQWQLCFDAGDRGGPLEGLARLQCLGHAEVERTDRPRQDCVKPCVAEP